MSDCEYVLYRQDTGDHLVPARCTAGATEKVERTNRGKQGDGPHSYCTRHAEVEHKMNVLYAHINAAGSLTFKE